LLDVCGTPYICIEGNVFTSAWQLNVA